MVNGNFYSLLLGMRLFFYFYLLYLLIFLLADSIYSVLLEIGKVAQVLLELSLFVRHTSKVTTLIVDLV